MPLPIGAEPALPPTSLSSSINGTDTEALERFKITEILQGFPAHRDAYEWTKFRALFAEQDAYVFTTWGGAVDVDEFIKISKVGYTRGVRISHRVNGTTVDLAKSSDRALGKLKTTITQRLSMPSTTGEPCEVDIEAEFRACFFLQKYKSEWKTHFYKGFYEKDKPIPVNPTKVPHFDETKLASFPEGYKYLAYGQSDLYDIMKDLPQSHGEAHDRMYEHFVEWLEGGDLETMKVKLGAKKP